MMWLEPLSSFMSVNKIRDFAKNNKIAKTRKETRASVKIALIDDEKFDALNNLTTYGYVINSLPDINNISSIKSYDIILCDLMGVGTNFDASIGGASIIREIKVNYPTKFVIAYTGARANSTEALAAKEYADLFLKKDAELTTWTKELDSLIDLVIDPYQMWLLARRELVDNEVELKDIIKLEDAYVRSVFSRDVDFSLIKSALGKLDLSGSAKSVIQGLISSAIYALVFGV